MRCFRAQPAGGTTTATRYTAPSPPLRQNFRASPAWGSTWCTCRRSIQLARCIARVATTRPPPHRQTWDRRGRSVAMRAVTIPFIPAWAPSTTSTTSSPRHAIWAWRSRWTWRCNAHRIIRGPANTGSGSPSCRTAPSPTRRIHRRSTRTSIRSTSTTIPRACTTKCCAWCNIGLTTASSSFASTIPTPNHPTSGPG
ncbi:Uncharacterised protein [Mycobacterium tuberculosis]|uniref:Uncharacterized protein n=1 Tax=Mycobacterium tuberculosis TaxID=1773 RepID=A0A654U6X5_MYCTX|nr:Uncharacterised protein [Mycobacterium tuberculosis]CNU83174.1 Uncharacterised protein [Mycobacterium tuberculosis]CNW54172.1 Uncharacterised protein [Mycobacterium tuberculosis]